MNAVRSILLPVFDRGQAVIVLIMGVLLVGLAVLADPLLALYMGIGAYVGLVARSYFAGLAPSEAEIADSEVEPISAFLDSGRLIERIGDGVWAPRQYKSQLWASSRISIEEGPTGRKVLRARKRDLKIIMAKVRRLR